MGSRTTALAARSGLWPLRALWLVLPLVAGFGLDDLTEGLRWPLIAEVAMWAGWFAGLVACLVPGPLSLTAVRSLAPAVIGVTVTGAVLGDVRSTTLMVGIGYGVIVTVMALLPVVGDEMINGSAYGSERRMGLRPPGFAIFGPIQLAWLLLFFGLAVPVIAISDGRWVVAAVAVLPGLGACWQGWRVLQQLSRRWLVFVPAGFVIHDPVLLAESILMRKSTISSLGPAIEADLERACDLSADATGLSLEVVLKESVTFAKRARKELIVTEADRIVFSPTLPGAVLREAKVRAINIDVPATT
ncbi:MAG: hypothetical protein GY724_29490 [Actinomycetia bacterium]|nr:hypothetical protein [Actinomycetes bacterium]